MTRQPALEKRITVAWPIPRLAPVNRSVRRGWLDGGGDVMMGFFTHGDRKNSEIAQG